jgi:hypothetical protein
MRYPHSTAYTLDVIKNGASTFRPEFLGWVANNWGVWLRFWEESQKVRATGRTHYSGRTIGEYIRHQTALSEPTGDYKVNDHAWPDCCRLFMALDHTAEGFFELRGRT